MLEQEYCYMTESAKAVTQYYILQGLEPDLALEMTLRTLGEAETFEV